MTNSERLMISVQPSDKLFFELGHNNYNYLDLISELIDNSIAARIEQKAVKVVINITVNEDNNPLLFEIIDNASGISYEDLADAISPGAMGKHSSLNEHGLGMKQAIAGIGELDFLTTKTIDAEDALRITEFKFGEIPVEKCNFEYDSGTKISVKNINPVVQTNPSIITRDLQYQLGARYRRFLRPDNRILDLSMRIFSEEGENLYNWSIEQVYPIYFHPNTRTNKPVINKFPIEGDGWKATLTFGYAPDADEYEDLGLERPSRFHPYHVSLGHQGLDLIRFDRVILFHQLSELDIVPARHNNYNMVRGELDLLSGFTTAITKNSVIGDKNFRACLKKVRDILNGEEEGPEGEIKDYIKLKTFPDQIPEPLLRDRLKAWLKSNPIQKKKEVYPEYSLEGISGFVDILADGECWELKTDKADALCVYQLFMYLDIGNFDKGTLVSFGHTTGAEVAVKHIKEKHEKIIELVDIEQLPITFSPNEEERTEYY